MASHTVTPKVLLSFAEDILAASDDDSLSAVDLRAWMRRAALRLGSGEGKRSGKEIIAGSLCRFDGKPENVKFEGRPMWISYLDKASAVLRALDEGSETKGSVSQAGKKFYGQAQQ